MHHEPQCKMQQYKISRRDGGRQSMLPYLKVGKWSVRRYTDGK